MARADDDFSTLLLGVLAGVGIGAALASSKSDNRDARRSQFTKRIRSALAMDGRQLLNASFGRARDRSPFWKLTVQDANQVRFVRIPLDKNATPYDDRTADKVIDVVRQQLASPAA